jgi:hypothetical protein
MDSGHLPELCRAPEKRFSRIQLWRRSRKLNQCFGAIPIFLGCGH